MKGNIAIPILLSRFWGLLCLGLMFTLWPQGGWGQASPRTVHVYVPLCDNAHQGIVRVPATLGNGQDPAHNLYWGALYGVRTFFERLPDWERIALYPSDSLPVRERILFRHQSGDTYLLAEAYDGASIQACTMDFLQACRGAAPETLRWEGQALGFGGSANLLAYIGHNGLMDFTPDAALDLAPRDSLLRQAIILACSSQAYFQPWLRQTGASPLLWTAGLLAPEAYILAAALQGWREGMEPVDVRRLAAEQYHRYQRCGIRAAWNLFRHGWE